MYCICWTDTLLFRHLFQKTTQLRTAYRTGQQHHGTKLVKSPSERQAYHHETKQATRGYTEILKNYTIRSKGRIYTPLCTGYCAIGRDSAILLLRKGNNARKHEPGDRR